MLILPMWVAYALPWLLVAFVQLTVNFIGREDKYGTRIVPQWFDSFAAVSTIGGLAVGITQIVVFLITHVRFA